MNEPPVRLCCGTRHWGAVCPDGKVMCCTCFDRVEQSHLSTALDGSKEDVCQSCVDKEKLAEMREKEKHA